MEQNRRVPLTARRNLEPDQVQKLVRRARVLLFVQAILGVAAGVFMLVLLGAAAADGYTEGVGSARVLTVVSIALAAVLLACAVVLSRGPWWVWSIVMAVESVTVVAGLIGVVLSMVDASMPPVAGSLSMLFGLLVIQVLINPAVKAWFAGEPASPQ